MTILFLFVALFVLMFIGVPVAVSLGLAGSLTIMIFSQDSVRSLAIKLFETSEHYTLLAIPFFLLAGAFMTCRYSGRTAIACSSAASCPSRFAGRWSSWREAALATSASPRWKNAARFSTLRRSPHPPP